MVPHIPLCPDGLTRDTEVLEAWFEKDGERTGSQPVLERMRYSTPASAAMDGARIQCKARVRLENGLIRLKSSTIYIIAVSGKKKKKEHEAARVQSICRRTHP